METLLHVLIGNKEELHKMANFVAKMLAKALKCNINDPLVKKATNTIITLILLPECVKLSRALNHREYYYFDKNNKMQIFDENSEIGKKKKNEFLGLKKRNVPAKKNIKTLMEHAKDIVNR